MADKNRAICKAIIVMHSFTGCDSVSAFMGRDTSEPLKLIMKNENYMKLFAMHVETLSVSSDLFSNMQGLVCHTYSSNKLALTIKLQSGSVAWIGILMFLVQVL